MDELARRYLLLGLRLERLSPGLIDSYVGPPELREISLAEPMPLAAELHDETMALAGIAEALPGADEATARRRAWFAGQLRAMGVLARRAGGEEIAYVDLVEELLGVPIRPVPDAVLLAARARLSDAVPGAGTLQERIARLRASLRVPADRVVSAVVGSAERFRAATRRDFELPDGEGIDWEEVHDQPWGAFAQFAGRGRTRVQVNVDLPIDVSGAAFLAAHEAYPGHHAEHVIKERTLIAGAGLGEATLRTMTTPEAVLSEGLADVAREVVMNDRELEGELRRIGREAGVGAGGGEGGSELVQEGDWRAAVTMRTVVTNDLQAAMGNAAIMLHQDGRPDAEVRAYLLEVGAVPFERIDHSMRVLRDPVNRTASFTYTEGARLIRPWLELTGQTSGFRRLLSEQLSPAVLLADLERSRSAVGDRT